MLREGRQEGGYVTDSQTQANASQVSARAKQGADTPEPKWSWVEATVWNERMLSALANGVKGGKWFSLIQLDGQIRRRLRALLRRQEKRGGFGRCCQDHQRWPNTFFAQAGLFAMHASWLAARQSR